MNPNHHTSARPQAGWRKSSFSGINGCVEINMTDDDTVHVRDSKMPDGSILRFTGQEWIAFVKAVKAGEFDT